MPRLIASTALLLLAAALWLVMAVTGLGGDAQLEPTAPAEPTLTAVQAHAREFYGPARCAADLDMRERAGIPLSRAAGAMPCAGTTMRGVQP